MGASESTQAQGQFQQDIDYQYITKAQDGYGVEKMPRPFPLRSTALRIMKPVLPKGGQSILSGSWARNKATEDSDRNYPLPPLITNP